MTAAGSQASVESVYAERNEIALALVRLMHDGEWNAGVKESDDPDWPLIFADTPAGQVSWHVPASSVPPNFPRYRGEWDGHDEIEKTARLQALAEGAP